MIIIVMEKREIWSIDHRMYEHQQQQVASEIEEEQN
jgi:hypothetical protein